MIRNILYLLRIGPGWDVEDKDGIAGKDFGPNWIRGLLFYLYRVKWCRDEYVRVEYFFEYVHYAEVEEGVCMKLILDDGSAVAEAMIRKERRMKEEEDE